MLPYPGVVPSFPHESRMIHPYVRRRHPSSYFYNFDPQRNITSGGRAGARSSKHQTPYVLTVNQATHPGTMGPDDSPEIRATQVGSLGSLTHRRRSTLHRYNTRRPRAGQNARHRCSQSSDIQPRMPATTTEQNMQEPKKRSPPLEYKEVVSDRGTASKNALKSSLDLLANTLAEIERPDWLVIEKIVLSCKPAVEQHDPDIQKLYSSLLAEVRKGRVRQRAQMCACRSSLMLECPHHCSLEHKITGRVYRFLNYN